MNKEVEGGLQLDVGPDLTGKTYDPAFLRRSKKVAWYDSKTPRRSGWAWGQEVLEGGAAAVSAKVGKGNVLLFGPEILQRAQPHGTFKFLFNGIFYGLAKPQIAQ